MVTLAFDTSGPELVVAVCESDVVVASQTVGERAQTVLLVVDELLTARGASVEDIERVAVGIGPGTFTGIRVGVATARGLCEVRSLPLAGVRSLEAIALSVGEAAVVAAQHARHGELFVQRFHDGVAASGVEIVSVDNAQQYAGADTLQVGPPSPDGLCRAASQATFGLPQRVVPEYGRVPDAVPRAQAR